ncbi:hypothetical protein UA08_02549 [Talaromyces atroroseus]|uniref:NmrA-like domain-containing protein n=1 Tax=Talaromyces atroroseus TaxID=1441469 RepID=A0A225B7T0_TALAT|nr:hypothetical protein UA08_02549 [Talaromyces atroroseus]OKL61987.1 hypothetical protein UA08_02549 [Talaromyces atroroseus]
MSHNILITGASGYLGGSLLASWNQANLPPYQKLYALVRNEEQAKAVKELYGAEPVQIDLNNESDIKQAIISRDINIVYWMISASEIRVPRIMIQALADVKKRTGTDAHFLFTSGAKVLSSHTGSPNDRPLLDTDPGLYELQRTADGPQPFLNTGARTNAEVIDIAESYGVRSYIFVPCIVYGRGEGFGNPISIQTVAIVRAAKRMQRMYTVDDSSASWPVCHLSDNTALFLDILRAILSGQIPNYGKNGFYLAASGSVKWHDLFGAMAKTLVKRGVIHDESLTQADDAALEQMAPVLQGVKSFVPAEIGGHCTLTAVNGHAIGWKAKYPPEHIFELAEEEVDWVLAHS